MSFRFTNQRQKAAKKARPNPRKIQTITHPAVPGYVVEVLPPEAPIQGEREQSIWVCRVPTGNEPPQVASGKKTYPKNRNIRLKKITGSANDLDDLCRQGFAYIEEMMQPVAVG